MSDIKDYFETLKKEAFLAFKLASKARNKGYDPSTKPEIVLAKNLAERVIGLISVVAPQIVDTGAIKRISELEKEFGSQDWRVAFKIALEIAKEKFCKFKDKREAMEVGIRTGFAYVTVGAVSAPLEGFTKLELRPRLDGNGEYFCLYFAGPVRAAGGTSGAVCVLIADYIRKQMGYAEYDPTKKEIQRCHAEITDYHEWVTNLQYFPSKEETEFLLSKVPVEISGDPSEKYEVSNVNLKNLPRIPMNRLRSGYCLIYSSMLPLKGPKIWGKISRWGDTIDFHHWDFLEEFVNIQKKAKAREGSSGKKDKDESSKREKKKVKPDYTFITDLVAGRPVFGHPLANGAFRLRYGRSRMSGFSAQSIHPASMRVLNDFIAIATQVKVERPGKAAALSSCDTINGPIVKLKNGSVVYLDDEKKAKEISPKVKEILYIGDILVNYGDFFDRAHPLVPAGYVPEEWILEFEEAIVNLFGTFDYDKIAELVDISPEKLKAMFNKPITTKISYKAAYQISKRVNVPLHPNHIFYWNSITPIQLRELLFWLDESAELNHEEKNISIIIPFSEEKRILELLGVPHDLVEEKIIIKDAVAEAFLGNLGVKDFSQLKEKIRLLEAENDFPKKNYEKNFEGEDKDRSKKLEEKDETKKTTLELLNVVSEVKIKDLCGTFIGSRMGRPEKAKMRKLTGSPHALFPVGEEGGKFRSIQSALEKGKITSSFSMYYCKSCRKDTVFSVCQFCDKQTEPKSYCEKCGYLSRDTEEFFEENSDGKKLRYHKVAGNKCDGKLTPYRNIAFDIKESFPLLLKKIKTNIFPDLIKGVRGTSNKEHIPEHLIKGILRAKHKITVNKDGTIRYDCSEIPITHFKPKEIGVSVEKLIDLGYDVDIHNKRLINEDQVLEIKPQDILLPCSPDSPEEAADEILFRTANFVDELLIKLYGQKSYYNLKSKKDLVGHYTIGLAPHTSAGILTRIIGFSQSQGFVAHPYVHAAMRRDCDGDEGCILLLMDAFLNFSKKYLPKSRGSTMDAPLVLTYYLNPSEVDDMVFNMDVAWSYPLTFYRACQEFKMPWEVKIPMINDFLGTPRQFEKMGFTHDTNDINQGVLCSSYKTLPSMVEKLENQMALAVKLRAVKTSDVARLVIDKHFMKDTKGNLRKFSQQTFRCVECNEKYRRPPLIGKCSECGGRIIFTVSEGSVGKYLNLSLELGEKYDVPAYLKQSLELLKLRFESVFGREKERQENLGTWA